MPLVKADRARLQIQARLNQPLLAVPSDRDVGPLAERQVKLRTAEPLPQFLRNAKRGRVIPDPL